MSNRTFTAQLVITTDCNLACKYCYMSNTKTNMSVSNLHAIYNALPEVLEKYDCHNYQVSYFGGEPLKNFSVIKAIDPVFKADPKCKNRVIISNGLLLTEDIISYVKENNIGFSWSFDGHWNNTNRVFFDNTSSVPAYMDKLDLIKELSPHTCKTMVSPSCLDTLCDNYEYLTDTLGMSNIDYTMVRDPIWTENDITKFALKCKELTKVYIADLQEGKKISVGFFTLAILDMYIAEKLGKRPYSCFAGSSGLGFMPDGKAYACARFGSHKELPIFDYITDRWFAENYEYLLNPAVCNPIYYPSCNDCTIRQYCNGGCNYNHIKNGNSPIPEVCELFKIIYFNALEIFDALKDNSVFTDIIIGALNNVG